MTARIWRPYSKRIFCLWTFLVVTFDYQNVVVDAATTYNRNAQTAIRASPTGGKSSARRVMEPAFANAGTVPGLEIWRIEDFKPVPYPKNEYGKFYSGDSYIILKTKERNGIFSWDIHFWLGSETTQDESGTAAILSVHLDDQLGGDPVQHREVQEHESQLFLSNFKSGIRYLPGGISSGFAHVDRNAFEKRLFQIKGKRNIRVKQVDVSVASMNKGDCFILDVGNDIYVYVGAKSKRTERLRAISAANQIRDQDHSGRSRVHVIDEFSREDEVATFFNQLGSGSPADVPEESAGGDDEQFENSEERSVTLYQVSDKTGRMQIQEVGQKPLRQNQLDTNDCFVLDTVSANIFVWIGKQCNKKEKDEAMSKAQEFLTSKHYPAWTHINRIVEGGEPSIFRQYFQTWQGTGELHPRLIRSIELRPTELAQKSSGELPEFMPDDGSGDAEIYYVENSELLPVPSENYGKLFGGDSYVIKYHCTNGKWVIYIWQGKNSKSDDKASSIMHSIKINEELEKKAIQIRAAQDHESKHFLQIFKGNLITFLNGHISSFKNAKEYDSYVEGENRLYRVRGTTTHNSRASQQPTSAKSLESDDVFFIENGTAAWLWFGKNSEEVEKDLASSFLGVLAPDVIPTMIEEGEEPSEFWDAIGGKAAYNTNFKANRPAITEPLLFHAHVLPNGRVRYEEIHDFEQDDLDQDDVMVLDTTEEVFVWIGKHATEDEEKQVLLKLPQHLEKYNRDDTIIITTKQGEEPEMFSSVFPSWDPNLLGSVPDYATIKQRLQEQNETIRD